MKKVFFVLSMVMVALLSTSCAKPKRDVLAGKLFCDRGGTSVVKDNGGTNIVMGFGEEGQFISGFMLVYSGDYELEEREDGMYNIHFMNKQTGRDWTDDFDNLVYDPKTNQIIFGKDSLNWDEPIFQFRGSMHSTLDEYE